MLMNLKKYRNAFIYPLVLWVIFKLVAFLFGFSSYPDLALEMLLSDSTSFLPLLFGFWIGAASDGDFTLLQTLANAVAVALIIGALNITLVVFLINNSPVFLTYASSVYASRTVITAPLLSLAVAKWIISIFTITIASGSMYLLLRAFKHKK